MPDIRLVFFNKFYFMLSLFLFGVEKLIALLFHGDFIRSYFSDDLVVILLYCMIKSFRDWPMPITITGVLMGTYTKKFYSSLILLSRSVWEISY